jgi:hypothetical protein
VLHSAPARPYVAALTLHPRGHTIAARQSTVLAGFLGTAIPERGSARG